MSDPSNTDQNDFRGEITDHTPGLLTSEAQADEWEEALGNYQCGNAVLPEEERDDKDSFPMKSTN